MVQGPPDSTTSLLQRLQGRRRSERSAEVRAGALTRNGLGTRAIEDHHGEVMSANSLDLKLYPPRRGRARARPGRRNNTTQQPG